MGSLFGNPIVIYRLKFVRLRLQLGFTAKWIQITCAFCSINNSSKSSLFRSLMSSRIEVKYDEMYNMVLDGFYFFLFTMRDK